MRGAYESNIMTRARLAFTARSLGHGYIRQFLAIFFPFSLFFFNNRMRYMLATAGIDS